MDAVELIESTIWAELGNQCENARFGPYANPATGVIDGRVNMSAVARAVLDALDTHLAQHLDAAMKEH